MANQNQNTSKIVDLKIKGAEALGTIDKLTKELEAQKRTISELNAEKKKNGELTKEQSENQQLAIATSKQLQKELNAQNKVLQNNAAENRAAAGSLKELRAQYNNLKTTYEELDDVQRSALIPQMREIKNRIEESDRAIGNYGTSIGGYEEAIQNALPGFGRFQKVIQGLGIDASATARVMAQNVVTSLRSVGASMKALMANPLIAGIAVILATILAIREAISKNQQAMDSLQRVFAPFKVIVDAFFRGLGDIIGVIIDGISKFIEFIVPANVALRDSIEAEKELQALRKDDIKDIEWIAKSNRTIAELRDKLLQKEKFSAEQRIAFSKQIQKELEKQMKDEIQDANRELRAFELRNSIAIRNKTLTDEELKQYAELRAKVDDITAANIDRGRAATKATNTAISEINAEKAATEKAEAEKRKQYADTAKRRKELQLSINRELEDIANSLLSSEQTREIAETETKFQRNRETIQKQLKDGTDLTIQARRDLTSILKLLNEREKIELAAIDKKYKDDEFQKLIDAKNEEFRMLQELNDGNAAYEAQRLLDEAALKLERRREALNNEFELEREMAQSENDMLKNLDEEAKDKMFLTQEAYEIAVIKSNKRVADSNSELRKGEIEKAQQLLSSIGSIAGGLSELFGEIAGKSKSMQKFQKALGLVQIAADMAVGIAGAIKAGAGVPFPANIPAIAAGVTAVITGITSAIRTLKSSGDVEIPTDLKTGAGGSGGSAPSVSIPTPVLPSPTYTTTTLSLGNSDTSARIAQSNQADDIKAAIKEAYSEMPSPVVKVVDIQSATAAAENIKNIAVI
jgi:hypothetical protein